MSIIDQTERRISPLEIIKSQCRVFHALILRDIKSRWGSTPAYVITFIWPLAHILILVGIWTAAGRVAPYGESNVLWFAISMLPFMACIYVARFLMVGLLVSKPLIAFPLIKLTDLVFSRIIIEVLNSVVLIVLIALWLWALDVEFYPHSIKDAFLCLCVSILLGLGFGIVNGLIGVVFHMWLTGFALLTIILWMTSGVMFDLNALPYDYVRLLYWQPITHLVEWMREAYYPGYKSMVLDRQFIFLYSLVFIVLGLSVERFARGRIVL